MKKFIASSAILLTIASQAVAGTMYISPIDSKTKNFKENLARIAPISFKSELTNGPVQLIVKDKETTDLLYSEPVENLYAIKFASKPALSEKMVIEWGDDRSRVFRDTSDLVGVESVEILDFDETDSDEDGLTDYEELYVYETNPYVKDTDGDGFSDSYEVSVYTSGKATLWNPKVADLPEFSVELVQMPRVFLTKTKNTTETETVSISESTTQTTSKTVNHSYATSASEQIGWNVGLSIAGGTSSGKPYFVGTVSAGCNGSNTSSYGTTWGSTDQTTAADNFIKAVSTAKASGETITGAKVQVFAKVVNIGHIAYNVENLSGILSAYTMNNDIERIVEVKSNVNATLEPGEALEFQMQDASAPVSYVERFISNPGALFLTSIAEKLTKTKDIDGYFGQDDFTGTITDAYSKTAKIVIDYGPSVAGDESVKMYRVATLFKPNEKSKGLNDKYLNVNLKEIVEILQIPYNEGVLTIDGKERKGLISIGSHEELTYNEEKKAMWYVSVVNSATPSIFNVRAIKANDFSLQDIEVSAGDEVRFFYSEDKDGDGLSLYEETLLGISDNNKDTDGDGLSDFKEVNGWVRDDLACGPFKTNPALKDSDFDGLIDPEDPAPLNRELGTSADIDDLSIAGRGATRTMVESVAEWRIKDVLHQKTVPIIFVTDHVVSGVSVTHKGKSLPVAKVPGVSDASSARTSYKVELDSLVMDSDTVHITLTAEDGESKSNNAVIIASSLGTVESPILRQNDGRNMIIVDFEKLDDARVDGYVIVRIRAEYASLMENLHQLAPTKFKYVAGRNVVGPEGEDLCVDGIKTSEGNKVCVTVVGVVEPTSETFEDKVGGGSPYYSYRVFAFSNQGDHCIYSESKGFSNRSVGRIGFQYQLVSVGTEYWFNYKFASRYDMQVVAEVVGGSTLYHLYDYWFYNAGSSNSPYTLVWETMADNKSTQKDSDDQPINVFTHLADVGSDGVQIKFKNTATVKSAKSETYATVNWKYEELVNALLHGAPADHGVAPLNDFKEMTFTWGSAAGICHNADCKSCGSDPHAGMKFKFKYRFID